MKLLYVVSTLSRCGPTNQLYNIVMNVVALGHEVTLVVLSPEPKDSMSLHFEKLDIRIVRFDSSRLTGFLVGKLKMKKLLASVSPDCIHTQGFRADVLLASLKSSIPHCCTIRNFPQLDYKMTYGKLLASYMVWRHVKAMRNISVCVGVSDSVVDNLNRTFKLTNVTSVLNGVDTDSFYPASAGEKNLLRKKLSLPATKIIWVCSGHLSPRKDPLFLVDAFNRGVFPEGHALLFIGEGELERECRDASNSEDIYFAGRVSNVSEYLRACDFYISSSVAEGMPNAALEALGSGLPVLLSDIPPHRELLKVGGEIGVLYILSSIDSLSAAVEIIDNGNGSKRWSGIVQITLSSFSAEAMANKYVSIYSDCIKEN
jgi:glycosyltransferase involved in cell wall biosynthesis